MNICDVCHAEIIKFKPGDRIDCVPCSKQFCCAREIVKHMIETHPKEWADAISGNSQNLPNLKNVHNIHTAKQYKEV